MNGCASGFNAGGGKFDGPELEKNWDFSPFDLEPLRPLDVFFGGSD